MAAFFFVGTVIHEFSHLIMANLLFVHTGKMELLPKLEGNTIRLGSVEIVKPDPFRRLLIGVAPFLMGTTIIILTLFSADFFDATHTLWIGILALLIVFQIGNTMFSSKKDMEGASFFLVLFIIAIVTLYLLGFRTSLDQINSLTHERFVGLTKSKLFYCSSRYINNGICLIIDSTTNSSTFIINSYRLLHFKPLSL
jgi:hypothetical protein